MAVDPTLVIQRIGPSCPVLFVDTCALLDLIRLPERSQKPEAEIWAAKKVFEATTSRHRRLQIVVPMVVATEWDEHRASEQARIEKWVDNLAEGVRRVEASSVALSGNGATSVAPSKSVVKGLCDLGDSLITSSMMVDADDSVKLAAYGRETEGKGPARKGKQCIKDCTIVETVLQITRGVRATNTEKSALLTSNTSDFYNSTGSYPHPDLATDFLNLKLDLGRTWGWAAHLLGL